ncbi:myosin light chain kinase, smooth muscle-like isoform X2 [Dendropsophus ebraccatus]|uniref:myosin light chain kinase, smooth muscle-like isoform X2 n=1 Tax=Dendropsophus ebraccatus TaxID=150705 RepID=UPI0038321112
MIGAERVPSHCAHITSSSESCSDSLGRINETVRQTGALWKMSYTSTLRIQLGKPPLNGSKEGQARLSENGCRGPQHIDLLCGSLERSKRMVLPGELHMKLEKNWENNVVKTAEDTGKVSEINMTARKMPCNIQVVKTTEKFLTVTFELCPQSGGELCVRRVKSPVPILTTAPNAIRRMVRDGPLPTVKEACQAENCHTPIIAPEIERVKATTSKATRRMVRDGPLPTVKKACQAENCHTPITIPEIERVKATTSNVWENREREGKRASSTALESPNKKSSLDHSRSVSFSPEPIGSPSKEPVSPKRKPHRSGDSLKILDGVSHIEVKKGEQAELRCSIQGTPPLAASWVRNKKPVGDDPRISVRTSETQSFLLIRQVCEKDSGSYTLCVQDQTGSIQHHISLAVVDRPSSPSGKPVISALQQSSLTLSWSGPCYDGGSAVLRYSIEVKQVGQDNWRLLTDTCTSTSYHVKEGLVAGERYQFRVSAANAYGISEAGAESDAVIMASTIDGDPECEEPVEYTEVTINTTNRLDDLYVKLEKLGMGKFGQVYKLQEKATGKIRAGKFFKARLQKDIANARAEVELMNKLHHPRLVHCVAAFQEPGSVILVLEYIAGGELFERIVADDFEHTEITSIEYMSQILSGVEYMHQQGIVHLDLKPENIVCVSKVNTKVKIIDFGLARKLEAGVPVKVLQGTAEFVAPEVIAFEPVGFTTDMWSLGVICYILLSGDSPFQGDNDTETLQNITSGSWEFDEETDSLLSDPAKDFIRRLLQKNMKSRLTAVQALNHPWIKDKAISSTKTLSKEKIKKFLARQKWQKTGKAVLALKRMAMLSNKSDSNSSPTTDDDTESKKVFSLLQEQLQRPPVFSSPLKDQSEVAGSSARFHCHIEGFPDPEVLWFFSGSPIQECKRFQIDYEDSGSCTLIISDVLPGDAGVYTCQATNSHGQAETSAKLTVHCLRAERSTRDGTGKTA